MRRVSRAIASQWIAVSYGAAVTVFLLFFLARKLGSEYLAIYLYLQTIASLYSILQDGGFQALVFREEVASSRDVGLSLEALISGYYGHILLCSVFGIGIVLFLPLEHRTGFLLAIVFYGLKCIINLISSVLKGKGLFEKEALWRIKSSTLQVFSVVLIVGFTKPTPEKVFLSLIIGQLLLLLTRQARTVVAWPRLSFLPWRVWKTSMAFTVVIGATTIYFKSDIILLRHLQPDLSLVGNYGAAFQILEGVILLATPVVHVCFRHLRLSWLDKPVFLRRLGRIVIGAFLSAVILGAGGILLAPQAIDLAYGQEYLAAAKIVPLLLASLIFLLPNFILTQAMIALNLERHYAMAACLCAIFNVGANFLLIPRYLATGAALSTIATEGLLTLLLGYRLLRWRSDAIREAIPCEAEEKEQG